MNTFYYKSPSLDIYNFMNYLLPMAVLRSMYKEKIDVQNTTHHDSTNELIILSRIMTMHCKHTLWLHMVLSCLHIVLHNSIHSTFMSYTTLVITVIIPRLSTSGHYGYLNIIHVVLLKPVRIFLKIICIVCDNRLDTTVTIKNTISSKKK